MLFRYPNRHSILRKNQNETRVTSFKKWFLLHYKSDVYNIWEEPLTVIIPCNRLECWSLLSSRQLRRFCVVYLKDFASVGAYSLTVLGAIQHLAVNVVGVYTKCGHQFARYCHGNSCCHDCDAAEFKWSSLRYTWCITQHVECWSLRR